MRTYACLVSGRRGAALRPNGKIFLPLFSHACPIRQPPTTPSARPRRGGRTCTYTTRRRHRHEAQQCGYVSSSITRRVASALGEAWGSANSSCHGAMHMHDQVRATTGGCKATPGGCKATSIAVPVSPLHTAPCMFLFHDQSALMIC